MCCQKTAEARSSADSGVAAAGLLYGERTSDMSGVVRFSGEAPLPKFGVMSSQHCGLGCGVWPGVESGKVIAAYICAMNYGPTFTPHSTALSQSQHRPILAHMTC
jgi:hypothetical protein